MRRFLVLCALVIAISQAFAQAPTPKPLSPFEQELVNNQKQFIQALQDKNSAYVGQSVSDDFKGIGQSGDFFDRSDMVSSASEGWPKDFRIYDIEVVRLDDSCAVVAYNEIVPGSHPRYRHMSDTWTKEGGKWKLKFEQVTPNLWSAQDLD